MAKYFRVTIGIRLDSTFTVVYTKLNTNGDFTAEIYDANNNSYSPATSLTYDQLTYNGGAIVRVDDDINYLRIKDDNNYCSDCISSLLALPTIDFYFNNAVLYGNNYDYNSELTVTVGGIYNPFTGGTYSQPHYSITGGDSESYTYTFRPGDTVTIEFSGYVTQGTLQAFYDVSYTYNNNDPSAYNNWVISSNGNSYSNTFIMPNEYLTCTIDIGNSY